MQSKTLRGESRVTESAQEIVDSIPCNCEWYSYINSCQFLYTFGVEDVSEYSTHSMRKTKPSVIYDKTHNVDAVRRLLGQSSVTATSAYLGVSDNSALELARTINI